MTAADWHALLFIAACGAATFAAGMSAGAALQRLRTRRLG